MKVIEKYESCDRISGNKGALGYILGMMLTLIFVGKKSVMALKEHVFFPEQATNVRVLLHGKLLLTLAVSA